MISTQTAGNSCGTQMLAWRLESVFDESYTSGASRTEVFPTNASNRKPSWRGRTGKVLLGRVAADGVRVTATEHQPVTVTVDAVRALAHGGSVAEPLVQSLAWTVALVAVFATWSVRRFDRG